jgi:hypothetical protein
MSSSKRKNVLYNEDDPVFASAPEVGYASFMDMISPLGTLLIVFLASIASGVMLSIPWFTSVVIFPSDYMYWGAQRDLLVYNNATNLTLLTFDLNTDNLRSTNAAIQGLIIFLAYVLIRYLFTRFDGQSQDGYLLLGTGVSEMLFHNEKYAKTSERFTVIVKIVLTFIAHFLGWLLGYVIVYGALKDSSNNDSFSVSNCTEIAYGSVGCRLATGYDESALSVFSARWIVCIAAFFIYTIYYLTYTMIRHKEKWQVYRQKKMKTDDESGEEMGETINNLEPTKRGRQMSLHGSPIVFAVFSSLGSAALHILVSKFVGSKYNLYYYIITTAFTRNTSQSDVYAWPGLIMIFIVVVGHAVFAIWSKYASKRNLGYESL